MLKKLINLIFFSLIFIPLVFSQTQNSYTNQKYSYSVNFPHHWVVSETDNNTVAANPQEKNLVSINILIGPLPDEAQSASPMQHLQARDVIKDWDTVKDSGEIKLNNEPGVWVKAVTPYTIENNKFYLANLQAWTVHDNKIFTITALAIDLTPQKALDRFNKYETKFKQTLSSFKFTDWDKIKWQTLNNWPRILPFFLLILAIEFAMPAIIRLIAKKALSPLLSCAIVIILFIANTVIFPLLGATIRFNPIFFLIALISFFILNAGYKKY